MAIDRRGGEWHDRLTGNACRAHAEGAGGQECREESEEEGFEEAGGHVWVIYGFLDGLQVVF